jgi:hypothetical protein
MHIISHDINKIQVPEEKYDNECFCSLTRMLFCILVLVLVIESRRVRWRGHVTHDETCIQMLVGESHVKRPFGITWC